MTASPIDDKNNKADSYSILTPSKAHILKTIFNTLGTEKL